MPVTSIGGNQITNSTVLYADIQNVSTNNRLLGRSTAGPGDVEEIVVSTGLSLSGGNLTCSITGTVTSVTGTTNRITSSGGTTPVIDISSAYVGQTSLTTLGTITTGTLSTGAVIAGVTMTLGSDGNYDMYYRNSSGVLTKLSNGTTGQFIGANTGAAPTWQTPSISGSASISVRAYNVSGGISALNTTDTVLTFNTENYDTDTMHNTSTLTSRIYCNTAGKFTIQGQVEFESNSTGLRKVKIVLNGSTLLAYVTEPASATTTTVVQVNTDFDLAVNDYIELIAYQDSGTTLRIDDGVGITWFAMHRQANTGSGGSGGSVDIIQIQMFS